MPEEQVIPAPKSRKKLGILAVALALVLGGGGIFLWFGLSPSTNAGENAGPAATLPLETFVVNLSGSSQRGYLRIGISLGLSQPVDTRRRDEAIPVALVRDTILSVLSAAQPEQLLQAEGKRQLKAEILRALQDRVPQLGVQDVYFTEFLVQM